jgi:hypothetical protein
MKIHILGNRQYMEIAREKHNRKKGPTEQVDQELNSGGSGLSFL